LLFILWFQIKRENIFKSMLFLKEEKLRIPIAIIIFGVLFFTIREVYKALELVGFNPVNIVVELLESISVVLFFIGTLRMFHLLYFRKKEIS
ncbi:MAG: hypothetical protein ACE5J9_09465, partial [Methanosarcinales archaeon]